MSGIYFQEYDECHLCPRECGARRNAGEAGFCGCSSELRIGAMLPHFGEEPCLSGRNGSGTVFFSGCPCACFFCQNHQISQEGVGKAYGFDAFVRGLRELAAQGVHNLNFVTPEHYMPTVLAACRQLRAEGCGLPFLWNSSGYAKRESILAASELVDVFMPDFKFAIPELAQKCMGDRDYAAIALAAIDAMVDRTGFLRPWDESGEICASRGTIVRHLVLPSQLENSMAALDMLYSHFGPLLPISIMSQFMPMPECSRRGFLDRQLEPEEYRQVCAYAEKLGFTRVFVQLENGDNAFAPDFTSPSPFKGNEAVAKRTLEQGNPAP